MERLIRFLVCLAAISPAACDVKTSSNAPPGEPSFVFTPTWLTFADTLIGRFADLQVTVSNLGLTPGVLSKSSGLGPPYSALDAFPITVPALGTVTLTFRFAPTTSGTFSDTFTVDTTDPAKPTVSIPMSGNGVDATKTTLATPATAPLTANSRIFRVSDTRAIALSPGTDTVWGTADDAVIVIRDGSPPTLEVVPIPGLSADQFVAINPSTSRVYLTDAFNDRVVRLDVSGAASTTLSVPAGVPLGTEVSYSPLFVGKDNVILAVEDADTGAGGIQAGAVFVSFSPGAPVVSAIVFDTATPSAAPPTHGPLLPTAQACVPHSVSTDRFFIARPGPDGAFGGGDDRILGFWFSPKSGFTLLAPFHVEISANTLTGTTWSMNSAISRPFAYNDTQLLVYLAENPASGAAGQFFGKITFNFTLPPPPSTQAALDLTAGGTTLTPFVNTDGGGTGAQVSFYMDDGAGDDFLTTITADTSASAPSLDSSISTGGLPALLADAELQRFGTDDVGWADTDDDEIRRVNLASASVTVLSAPFIAGRSAAPALADADNLVATASGVSGVHIYWLAVSPPALTTTSVAGLSSDIVSRCVVWSSANRTFLVGSPAPTNTITKIQIP